MKFDEYYLKIAIAVREKANCKGRKVGAVIVKDNRVISTGYNGTPEGMSNCLDSGCYRCDSSSSKPGVDYDKCICVHAEQNAVLSAARFGIALEGSTVYTTLEPCINCSKAMLQAKVKRVVYLRDFEYPEKEYKAQHKKLLDAFSGGVKRVTVDDPREKWANNES